MNDAVVNSDPKPLTLVEQVIADAEAAVEYAERGVEHYSRNVKTAELELAQKRAWLDHARQFEQLIARLELKAPQPADTPQPPAEATPEPPVEAAP